MNTLFSAVFFDITQDIFLKQHVDFNTRFREGNESSMLDLIFTNEDYMIENLRSIAPLGKSDHVGLLFTFITYSAIDSRAYGGKKHDYWKADMSEINPSLQKVKWEEEMENRGVNQSWRFFKSKIEEVIKNNVPLKERRKQISKPPWQTKRVCRSVKKQTQLWKRYERTDRNKEYEEYKKERNKNNQMRKKAKREYEKKLLKRFKDKPKLFDSYVRNKQKVKRVIPQLNTHHHH